MTSRLKFFAAAALGLVLATGTLADVSAKTVAATHAATTHIGKTHTAMTHHTRIATKGHRLHVAHLRHAHKLHVAHHKTGHHLVKATGAKGTKDAGVTHRERHADNRRVAGKPASVIR